MVTPIANNTDLTDRALASIATNDIPPWLSSTYEPAPWDTMDAMEQTFPVPKVQQSSNDDEVFFTVGPEQIYAALKQQRSGSPSESEPTLMIFPSDLTK